MPFVRGSVRAPKTIEIATVSTNGQGAAVASTAASSDDRPSCGFAHSGNLREVQDVQAYPDPYRRIRASKKAVDHGIGLAKALNAKVTAVTVSKPFHIFAVEPGMLTDTPDEYEKRIAALTGKHLKAAKDAATAAGVPCDVVHVEHEHPMRQLSIRREREDATQL